MLRGFLAAGWFEALADRRVDKPERKMNKLQEYIWDTIFDPLWAQRNDILHQEENKYNLAEDQKLTERITWYVQHKQDVLAHQDQFLAQHDVTRLHKMRRKTKREWVRHLDRARKAYDIERKQVASAQNVLTRYFPVRSQEAG